MTQRWMIAATDVLGPVLRGVVAGAVGTLARDMLWYARYREDGGDSRFRDWEFSSELQRWDDAPAPGKMAARSSRR